MHQLLSNSNKQLRLLRKSNPIKLMPKVGKKEFPYTPAGKAAAKKEAAKTGKKMQAKPSTKKGY